MMLLLGHKPSSSSFAFKIWSRHPSVTPFLSAGSPNVAYNTRNCSDSICKCVECNLSLYMGFLSLGMNLPLRNKLLGHKIVRASL